MKSLPQNPRRAFTLAELLVVIAIIATLGTLLLPALARTRVKSPVAGCLSNLHQLQMGWLMYKDDYNNILIPNGLLNSPDNQTWAGGGSGMDWYNSTYNTNTVILQTTLLAPYVRSNLDLYRCPADLVPSQNGFRVRSYSMNIQMGAIYSTQNYNPNYLQYKKFGDLTCPAPQSAFIFCDEHPASINDGGLFLDLTTSRFVDLPAAYHEGGCGFSFADGHAEIHRWVTPSLNVPVVQGAGYSPVVVNPANVDWLWLKSHSACQ